MVRSPGKTADWCSIQLARLSVHCGSGAIGQVAQVESLRRPRFLCWFRHAPRDLRFVTKRAFRFTSPVVSPWKRNNTVHGRLLRRQTMAGQAGVILIHG